MKDKKIQSSQKMFDAEGMCFLWIIAQLLRIFTRLKNKGQTVYEANGCMLVEGVRSSLTTQLKKGGRLWVR